MVIKKIIVLMIYLIVFFTQTCFAAEIPVFQKSQSYELTDIVSFFATSSKGANSVSTSNLEKLDFFYKEKVSSKSTKDRFYYLYNGEVGLLINGIGHKERKQSWKDGLLVNSICETGFTTGVTFIASPVNSYFAMDVTISFSPTHVAQLIGSTGYKKLDWTKYFSAMGFTVDQLWETGDISSGETGWKINPPDKEPVYMISRTSCGVNGLIGSTNLLFFLDEAGVQKERSELNFR